MTGPAVDRCHWCHAVAWLTPLSIEKTVRFCGHPSMFEPTQMATKRTHARRNNDEPCGHLGAPVTPIVAGLSSCPWPRNTSFANSGVRDRLPYRGGGGHVSFYGSYLVLGRGRLGKTRLSAGASVHRLQQAFEGRGSLGATSGRPRIGRGGEFLAVPVLP